MRTLTLVLALAACGTPAPEPAEPTPGEGAAGLAMNANDPAPARPAPGAVAKVGAPAPDFTLADLDGTEHTLSAYKGKTVVLEWFNPGCPYVVAAHSEGPLKDLARTMTDQGVVWLSINSGAPGKQGHGVEANKEAVANWSMTNPVLLDESGVVGRSYAAKTTPHMYVINPEGTLVYAGALDNAPRNEVPDVGRKSFVVEALEATLAGQAVKAEQTQPWGCSVKYGA